ncbi:MAG: ABC transporter permease [Spirochaetales bacterium]|nr:ABC transporter permease [Spirochaetales bacterium]
MGRIKALVQKEFRQIRRTKAYFGLIFIAPFVQLIVMGSAITNEVKDIPLVIVDQDRTPSSREIINRFDAVPLFDFRGIADSPVRAERLINRGEVKAALVIPRGFEGEMIRGLMPEVQVLIDGVDGNSAGVSLGYITSMAALIQKGWASGMAGAGGMEIIPRYFYNPGLESKLNFVPGLLGILLFMMTTMLTAINIVREKELGTLEQLMATPPGGVQLIIGKIIPFTVLGLVQFSMGLIAARVVFGIPVAGRLSLLYLMTLLFIMSTLGLGIFISTVTSTQQQAMFVAWFSMIFALLLSGFFVPVRNMPPPVQILTLLNPLRYFMSVLREIYLKGTPLRYLLPEAAAMGGMGLVLITAATLRFHRRLE